MMRRSRMPMLARQATAVLLLIAGAVTLRAAAPSLQLPRLRQQVVDDAGGPEALAQVDTFSFNFTVYATGDSPGLRERHQYDRRAGLYRYEVKLADLANLPVWNGPSGDRWEPAPDLPDGETLVAIYRFPRLEGSVYIDGRPVSGAENAKLLARVDDRVRNARAWMFLPLFMASPRLNAKLVPDVDDAERGHLRGFEAWWGTERGDSDVWTLYLDASGRLVRTDVWLRGSLNSPPTIAYWDDWQQQGTVKIAGERTIPEASRRLVFENLQVNRRVNIEAPDLRAGEPR
jgi:hypothetical protein